MENYIKVTKGDNKLIDIEADVLITEENGKQNITINGNKIGEIVPLTQEFIDSFNLRNTPEIDYKELLKKYMKLHMKDKKEIVLTLDLFTNNEMDQILNLEAEILNEPLQNNQDNNNKD